MLALREYQDKARLAVHTAWRAYKRTLIVMPTGTGKTVVFAALAADIVQAGGRVMILAHREELIRQAADKIERTTGLRCAIEKAEECAAGCLERIVVASVQTLLSESRRVELGTFSHIIVDEAHHVLADSYLSVLSHWSDANVLGVTATPDRGDLRDLGRFFDHLAFEYTLPEAISQGYLSKIRALTCPIKIDVSKVQVNGDFQAAGLGTALDPYLPEIAREIAEHCRGRKTLAFLPLIATSRRFVEFLTGVGLRAREVNGESDDRAQALEDFAAGKWDVLANAMLLTEGYDCPSIDCVVVLRPTKVRSLYAQMVGRGTRPHPGKENLLLLDFLWMTERHQLCRPAHLVSDDPEVAEVLSRQSEEDAGVEMDLDESALEEAKKEVVEEREAALAKKLAEMRHRKRDLVDPIQFAVSIGEPALVDYQPVMGADCVPPTPAQIEQLGKVGLFPGDVSSRGHAQALLDAAEARRSGGWSTPRQVRCLERYGWTRAGKLMYADAQKLISRIAANGWRCPHGLRREGS